jgi:NAD(P)-dependent dehydrogenase (short-subunit alcohol dehydrogenase family)
MTEQGCIVITGAGNGIGRALSIGFARDGFRVHGLGRNAGALAATQADCPAGAFSFSEADVADMDRVAAAMEDARKEAGPVFGLVCNAAVYPRIHFLDQSADDWRRALLINVDGVANCCRAALPEMLQRNCGRIVIVGSLASQTPIPGASIYSVSKGALHPLTIALSVEINRDRYPNVLVNEYLPSATRTSMSVAGEDPMESYPRVKALIELPSGGSTGRAYLRGQEYHFNRSPRAMLKRQIFKLIGRDG